MDIPETGPEDLFQSTAAMVENFCKWLTKQLEFSEKRVPHTGNHSEMAINFNIEVIFKW